MTEIKTGMNMYWMYFLDWYSAVMGIPKMELFLRKDVPEEIFLEFGVWLKDMGVLTQSKKEKG